MNFEYSEPQSPEQEPEQEKTPIMEVLERINYAAQILEEMGMDVQWRNINEENLLDPVKSMQIPLVSNGALGIRATYQNNNLKIWFTNGFENPKNSQRQEFVKKMIAAGLSDYVNKMGLESVE